MSEDLRLLCVCSDCLITHVQGTLQLADRPDNLNDPAQEMTLYHGCDSPLIIVEIVQASQLMGHAYGGIDRQLNE